MLSDDEAGEQQREGEELRRQEKDGRTAVTTTAAVLPHTLGSGRYIVRGVLGTGSTASTYRCTTLLPPLPQQAQQDLQAMKALHAQVGHMHYTRSASH